MTDSSVFEPRRGYTIEAVAESEGVSVATIRRWVRDKKFPQPMKRGGSQGRCVWYGETLNALRTTGDKAP